MPDSTVLRPEQQIIGNIQDGDYCLIPLRSTKGDGQSTIVDREDYERLSKYRWHLSPQGYAVRYTADNRTLLMHREITKAPPSLYADHINRNKLDNRRANLRTATALQSAHNTGKRQNGKSSKYLGVYLDKTRNKWRARIIHAGRQIGLGYFSSEEDAARARDHAARELRNEYACLNFSEKAGAEPLRVAASAAEVINGDQVLVSGYDLGDSDLATRGQADDVVATIESGGEPLVTQAPNSPAVTSDSGEKKPARKRKKVTSDSDGVKSQGKVVLPFRKKAISHVRQKEKAEWEIKECGCRLPKFPKWEWRDFENGHRLLIVIGYGKSKNNKRVKKRDCVRYYTHAAMKLFWENEHASQVNSSAKA